MGSLIYTFLISFVIASVLTPIIIKLAIKLKILDYPGGLKTHKKPTPYLGGAGIYISFVICSLFWIFKFDYKFGEIQGIIIGSSLIFILGLVDDIKKLSIPAKFFWQAISALVLIGYGIKIQFLPYEPLNILLSVLWVVGMTNAMNIIDVEDGLSVGIAITFLLVFFFLLKDKE